MSLLTNKADPDVLCKCSLPAPFYSDEKKGLVIALFVHLRDAGNSKLLDEWTSPQHVVSLFEDIHAGIYLIDDLYRACVSPKWRAREEVEPRRIKDGCCSPRRSLNGTGKELSEKWVVDSCIG